MGFGSAFSDHVDSIAGLEYTAVLVHVHDLFKKKGLDIRNDMKELLAFYIFHCWEVSVLEKEQPELHL